MGTEKPTVEVGEPTNLEKAEKIVGSIVEKAEKVINGCEAKLEKETCADDNKLPDKPKAEPLLETKSLQDENSGNVEGTTLLAHMAAEDKSEGSSLVAHV